MKRKPKQIAIGNWPKPKRVGLIGQANCQVLFANCYAKRTFTSGFFSR